MRHRLVAMRIIVTGLIGQYAFGGVTWDYIQYALGLKALGHDVWYLEDTGAWAYDPVAQEPSANCSHNVAYLKKVMEAFGMGDRWIYRNGADESYHGVTDARLAESLISGADVLVNVSGACWLRPVTAGIRCKLFMDGDPMFTQIGLVTHAETADRIRAHEAHFSFGLNIGKPGCLVPTGGLTWHPTVQPVALESWDPGDLDPAHVSHGAWSTVMNWSSYKPKEFEGSSYGQKDSEFLRFVDLPRLSGEPFVLAMGQGVGKTRPTDLLTNNGWGIVEPDEHLPDFESYRQFIFHSKAEWSVAKNGYVKSRSGWFSCRSACYLSAGRPVVVQDTGWSECLPSGAGVLAFATPDEAAGAIRAVASNYAFHADAARAYAKQHFDAASVCHDFLETAAKVL
ncbi:MAG: hypothetical protein WEB60_02265 [Terrimicrobiaceae bacterium]